jgi:hypothetical protein
MGQSIERLHERLRELTAQWLNQLPDYPITQLPNSRPYSRL